MTKSFESLHENKVFRQQKFTRKSPTRVRHDLQEGSRIPFGIFVGRIELLSGAREHPGSQPTEDCAQNSAFLSARVWICAHCIAECRDADDQLAVRPETYRSGYGGERQRGVSIEEGWCP